MESSILSSRENHLTSTGRFDQYVYWIVVAGVFLIPLFFLPFTSDSLELQKQVLLVLLAGVGLVLWLIGVIKEGKISSIATSLGLPIIALISAMFLASLFSVESFRSFFGIGGIVSGTFATWLAMAIFFLLIISVVRDKGAHILRVLILSSIIGLIFAIVNLFGLLSFIPLAIFKLMTFNTIGTINSVGMFSAVLLPLLAEAGVLMKDKMWRIIYYIGIVLSLFILVVINWWVLWVVAIAGMLMLVLFRSFNFGFKPSRFILPMVVIVVSVFLIITNLNLGFLKSNLPTEVAPSYGISLGVIKDVLLERPVFGYGPENFRFAFEKFGSQSLAQTSFSNIKFNDATSELFTFIVGNGIIGLLAMAFFVYSIVMLVIKKSFKERENSVANSALASIMIAFIFYPFNFVLLFMMWVILAIYVVQAESSQKKVNISIENSPRYSLISSVAFILGLILVLSGSYYMVVKYASDFVYAKAMSAPDVDKSIDKIVNAININPSDSRYYQFASNILLTKVNQELNAKDNDPDQQARIQNYVQSAFEVAKRATDRNPHDSINWSQRALVHRNLSGVVSGVEDLAVQYYQEALKINPSNPALFNSIGEVYLLKSQMKGSKTTKEDIISAQDNFNQAIILNSNFGRALYNLGITYDFQGKIKEATAQLEKLVPFNANDPGLAFELGLLYYRDNRKDEAFTQMQRAVAIQPKYLNALWYLALIYEEKGDLENAITRLQTILETDTGNKIVIDKINKLEKGEVSIPPKEITDEAPLENVK